MTTAQFKACFPNATKENIERFFLPLTNAMREYEIDTPRRQAAFLAQLAHESGSLRYVEELASGEAYEGRKDLGNVEMGDGKRFKGRGLIQLTGRNNYKELSEELAYDFIVDPEALEKPGAASYSAAWFWWSRHLNRLADIDAFEKITKKINGGLNGYEDRCRHWETTKNALRVDQTEIKNPKPI